MSRPRWRKIRRDLALAWGRTATMIVAIAAGVTGIGAVLSASTIASREIAGNYLSTVPASATLELDRVDAALAEQVRRRPGIADAQVRTTVTARMRIGPDEWRSLILFVVPDFDGMRIAKFTPQSGAWPPPAGTMLIERSARDMVPAGPVEVRLPGGQSRTLAVSGTVHDPGLAPAWQERAGYGYITPQTLAVPLDELKIRTEATSREGIEHTSRELAIWLRAQGRQVHEIQVPPPGRHPHESQMQSLMLMLLIFALLGLVLAAVLVATVIGGMLVQQVRQIGVMKAIGARTGQISALYAVQVLLLGLGAAALGLPLGTLAGRAYADVIAELLNLDLHSRAVPPWVYGTQLAAAVLVPLLVAAVPIRRAARITVREAISDYGVRVEAISARLTGLSRTLTMALRNAFRRRARLVLTLGLLSAGGALFLSGLNMAAAWQRTMDDGMAARHYDMEVRLAAADPALAERLRTTPGVTRVESWGHAPTSAGDVVSTYPDGGHGSFSLRGVPDDSRLLDLPVTSGRWLRPGDTDAVVLNSMAANPVPDAKPGDTLTLRLDGRATTWRVVGTVREIGSQAAAYVTRTAFEQRVGPPRDLRIATTDSAAVLRALRDVPVESATLATSELREAVDGHIFVLIGALIALAALMAIVGVLGLAAATGTSVVERTREFAVMQAIGATPRTVLGVVLGETVFIGLLSWPAAALLALPLSWAIGGLLGDLAFRTPLPLTFSPLALALWALAAAAGSALAGTAPARRAARLTIRQALAYV
ncbi:FtsX-like permease family protein [Nonomuraea phyllanthi]|uniref:ABC transporter permease n=1 Tax=Nonomuraea phyllanthi TaxID=2219224 RepID=UPI0012937082|nr:FtsX-like permease family protein [Nonomuraea phyllanthi]QFY10063.1 FtsX-like permease family protein [Nonomuraea phyllanthi]